MARGVLRRRPRMRRLPHQWLRRTPRAGTLPPRGLREAQARVPGWRPQGSLTPQAALKLRSAAPPRASFRPLERRAPPPRRPPPRRSPARRLIGSRAPLRRPSSRARGRVRPREPGWPAAQGSAPPRAGTRAAAVGRGRTPSGPGSPGRGVRDAYALTVPLPSFVPSIGRATFSPCRGTGSYRTLLARQSEFNR